MSPQRTPEFTDNDNRAKSPSGDQIGRETHVVRDPPLWRLRNSRFMAGRELQLRSGPGHGRGRGNRASGGLKQRERAYDSGVPTLTIAAVLLPCALALFVAGCGFSTSRPPDDHESVQDHVTAAENERARAAAYERWITGSLDEDRCGVGFDADSSYETFDCGYDTTAWGPFKKAA